MQASYTMEPMAPNCGVIIEGVDVSKGLSNKEYEDIHSALVDKVVVILRDQHLTSQQQVAFAGRFGEPQGSERSAFGKDPDNPDIDVLESSADQPPVATRDLWHTDFAGTERPSLGTCLYARVIPKLGGDTIWVNSVAAFDGLSDRMKAHVDGLFAYHDNYQPYDEHVRAEMWQGDDFEYNKKMRAEYRPVLHPVVRTHPVSGKKGLFVNESMTTFIKDLDKRESDFLLNYLFDHLRAPEFQCRHRWKANDLAIWDNRTSLHYALFDYSEHRLMHRIALEGDRPY